MQRVLLVIVLLTLLAASLAVGSFAAAWPFWSRAQAWRTAPGNWPSPLPGPGRSLQGSSPAQAPVVGIDAGFADGAGMQGTQVLLVADGPAAVRGWYAPGFDERSEVDGRGLATGLLPLVYAALEPAHPGLLDQPVGQHLREWAADPRGAITPRQLMWELSGLAGGTRRPWNPFDPQAQLLAGPDFMRAALAVRQQFPAGTTPVASPANAQLLALLAGRLSAQPYADVLESALWRRFAADQARAVLDHRRGEIAAHCCITATARDWLGAAMLLAQQGHVGMRTVLPPAPLAAIGVDHPVNPGQGLVWRIERRDGVDFLLLRSTGRLLAAAPVSGKALFWSGEDELPVDVVARLLGLGGKSAADSVTAE
jgi:hypothetical protein